MYYYIANRNNNDSGFSYTLVKRYESYEEAVSYCKEMADKWLDEGLNSHLCYDKDLRHYPELADTAKVVGAYALDDEYFVIHGIEIFATPAFFGGGSIE